MRAWLVGLGSLAVAAIAVAACSQSFDAAPEATADAAPEDTRPPTPPEWDRPVTRTDEATAFASRASCKFARGALPDETLGREIPTGTDIPLETIVVLMQENRSFDHYFGHFGKYAGRSDVESAPENATNPERIGDPSSPTHPWQHAEHFCFRDTNHEWDATHTQIDDGKMDGFYQTNGDARALWWYDEREIPFYYALGKAFAIGDHYFASVPGPTWPNRMYLHAGTSFGVTEDVLANIDAFPYPAMDAVVQDELEKRHVDWKVYSDGPAAVAAAVGYQFVTRWAPRQVKFTMPDFFADAAAGTLPPVVWVDPNALTTGNPDGQDEHPPAQLQVGEAFVASVVRALMNGPQWKKMAIFIMYDEHGGLFDHVAPPKACEPDDKPPVDAHHQPVKGKFDMYGLRVPLMVVSPYVKRGYVSHTVYDHTSLLRFIEAKHRVPALTRRDANANVPVDFFDFGAPSTSVPSLPDAVVDANELSYCKQSFSR